MKIAASYIEQSQYSFDGADTARVRAVVVDGSPFLFASGMRSIGFS